MTEDTVDHPYATLTPDVLLDAIESCGYRCDGTFLALNSYENRVYQVGIEDQQPIIAKFYRPDRWSNEVIMEEHEFADTLSKHDIPVIAPLHDDHGNTLFEFQIFRFALFPRHGGYWPELNTTDDRLQFGRLMGRFHAIGKLRHFKYRPLLSIEHFVDSSRYFLLENHFIPQHLLAAYESLTMDLKKQIQEKWDTASPFDLIRIHGDCHAGNILWTDGGLHFVDLDDCCIGPAIQDIWMLLSGEREDRILQLEDYLEGYTEFNDFNPRELHLIEALRTMRMMHYAAWLARRWNDPAFPKHFTWFNTNRYWEDHILSLREQAAAMNELHLPWGQFGR